MNRTMAVKKKLRNRVVFLPKISKMYEIKKVVTMLTGSE